MLTINVNYLPGHESPIQLELFHRAKLSRALSAENLSSLAQDVQAIFINIDWGKKGQTIKDFQQMKIESSKLMSKGLVFVWAPK
jgi:hypothetical protein